VDDYLQEEAREDHPPSETAYRQNGKQVTSLGVFEHWDSDDSGSTRGTRIPGMAEGSVVVSPILARYASACLHAFSIFA
jgi:hypothetical protein